MNKKKSASRDGLTIKGMFRVNIVDDPSGKPTIVGDSGWKKNLTTNDGFNQYIVRSLGSISGSKYITHAAIGTGGAPVAADTTLAGEQSAGAAVTAATTTGSKTLRITATFASSDAFVTATKNISNVGLFNTVTAGAGTLFAGNTYASSACATNQNVNLTYDLIFATA